MLSYNDLGTGTPIVLIHGLGSKKEAWIPQHELANKYRLIIPDLRGHGDTILNENLTIKNFALDIIHLLEYLKIPSAFICGLSLGGIVAQELYKQRPEMVRGLILSNTTSYIPFFLANGIIHLANQLLQTDRQKLIDHIVKTALYDSSYQKDAIKAFQIRDTYIKSARAPVGINYYSFLPFIKKPVLLLGSTHDKVTPSINLYLMKLFIRDARLSIFKNTGHLSNIEKKELFNEHLHHFIMAAT